MTKCKPKRKPKPTVAAVLRLANDAGVAVEWAKNDRADIAGHRAQIATLRRRAAASDVRARTCLKRAALVTNALPPEGLAELLSRAPGWMRAILIQEISRALDGGPEESI